MEKKSFEAFLQDVSNKELKIKKKEVESFLLEVLNITSKMKNQFSIIFIEEQQDLHYPIARFNLKNQYNKMCPYLPSVFIIFLVNSLISLNETHWGFSGFPSSQD